MGDVLSCKFAFTVRLETAMTHKSSCLNCCLQCESGYGVPFYHRREKYENISGGLR